MSHIAAIRHALVRQRPRVLEEETRHRAAVSLVLREEDAAAHLLFIQRAEHPDDPWSGHIAFPGGRIEDDDASPRRAAERETLEEVGLDLNTADCLGHLADITAANFPVLVSGFIYHVDAHSVLTPNVEVRETFWMSLDELSSPQRQVEHIFSLCGSERTFPAIDLLGSDRPVLWGLTYRFVGRLLRLLDREIPQCYPDV